MNENELAGPLHLQRLDKALNLASFLDHVEHEINRPLVKLEGDQTSGSEGKLYKNGICWTKKEKYKDKSELYNFGGVRKKRQWLKEILLSSSESEEDFVDDESKFTEKDLSMMLKEHRIWKHVKNSFYQSEENRSYLYYSAGLLSRTDRYAEYQRFIAGTRRKKNREKGKDKLKKEKEDEESSELTHAINEDSQISFPDDTSDELPVISKAKLRNLRRDKKHKKLDAQALTMKRHKLWVLMAKKEIGRCQKAKSTFRKEVLQNCRKLGNACMRYCRQKALQSQKTVKDKLWLLKRLTRTMQSEWKKFDRIMKEQSRRAEKEAEEQRKMDKEIMEAKRQQRKVNFLITLPELYAHFMKNKMHPSASLEQETNEILKQLEDDGGVPSAIDDYDSELLKSQALETAQEAFTNQQNRMLMFGSKQVKTELDNSVKSEAKEYKQPSVFCGQLKSYQLKGMNWLANLYYFGINGILADEMGLGKTVQSIAFLAHICEEYDTWGPFLIITPASTLHNWITEMNRFVPNFKIVPYWGNPEERKNLRKFFDGKNLGSMEASFHIVITSYQIVVQDFKFLNRLKWNYMILDEAQAIKSINSQRWKLLLGFSCRNRLLLSGTPIQNSMAELWALLHFIMPTLFDSHNWFNEWFSKDIEGHVENKTAVDEKHLNRLHMILKPFMLRRVKAEVENELSDKIEIMMYCPLTMRQKYLYNGLKNKISIDELLRSSSGSQAQQSSVTTSLMNLVMQFRKVCNHPELLERREVQSSMYLQTEPYLLPKLIYQEGMLSKCLPSKSHLLYNRLSIVSPYYINSNLSSQEESRCHKCFSFVRFIDMSPGEFSSAYQRTLSRWFYILLFWKRTRLRHIKAEWSFSSKPAVSLWNPVAVRPVKRSRYERLNASSSDALSVVPVLSVGHIETSTVLSELIFTSYMSTVYCFQDHIIFSMPETPSHRLIREQKMRNGSVKPEPLSENEPTGTDSELDIESCLEKMFSEDIEEESSDPQTAPSSPQSRRSYSGMFSNNKGNGMKEENYFETELPASAFPFIERKPQVLVTHPTNFPVFLLHVCSKVKCSARNIYCCDRSAEWQRIRFNKCSSPLGLCCVLYGSPDLEHGWKQKAKYFSPVLIGGLTAVYPKQGWNQIIIPDKHTLIMDAGKLFVLDALLSRLKAGSHRVLIYSQMTKMIDLLEEYMWHRKHKYMRLDGSSKISDRRDMVADFQTRSDIFVFLLSTRAGGVGINLTAADTVIFYDSDWNPTVDQQAMDRAHRLGQTKQVTVYRLICKSTIEERILQRAREKSEIQRMVISGGNFKPDTLKPKEVVSLLLDDDIEKQFRARQEERRLFEDHKLEVNREKMRERMRKRYAEKKLERELEEKRRRLEEEFTNIDVCGDDGVSLASSPTSPSEKESSRNSPSTATADDGSSEGILVVDDDSTPSFTSAVGSVLSPGAPPPPARGHRKRGRPRGSTGRCRASRALGLGQTPAADPVANQGAGSSSSSSAAGIKNVDSSHGNNDLSVCSGLPSGPPASVKRGRGRPRLLPLGPGHQGGRAPPALPVALGSALPSSSQDHNATRNPFQFYS